MTRCEKWTTFGLGSVKLSHLQAVRSSWQMGTWRRPLETPIWSGSSTASLCASPPGILKKNFIIERRNESLYSGTNHLFPYAQQDSIGTGATLPNLLKHSRHASFYRTCLNHPALLALKKKIKKLILVARYQYQLILFSFD